MTDELTTTRGTETADPTLTIPGTWNARDVGGRATPEGASEPIATGVLLRTASLANLEPAGVATLADLDVTTVLDLRSPQEVARDGADVVPSGAQVLALPFGSPRHPRSPATDKNADAEGIGEAGGADMAQVLANLVGAHSATPPDPAEVGAMIMEGIYRGFVTDPDAHAAVGTALTAIASSTHAVLVHCSAGKDRTGWIVALVQGICSVPREQILQEYLLSAQAAGALAASMPPLPGVDPALWDAVLTVRPEYLAAAEDQLDRTFGSLTGYLDAIGVDAQVRGSLRARFGVEQA
ncbi:protein-tyrosine phosphatase [Sanguibacter gelidistatuariae]|uniref:Protein-tyrosine phosphatase n=1 Tax=Sanguibacter gelidistatuariae TaxID=1814289 RepID=A0A1G6N6P3_9MICO|nr:tyrosine-protein phosphatase [Sanguibacter gelidistatuariae]SDC63104.1 protein-tyrosine phosphatase [Sanguibacter gelidistatuariae]